MKSINRLFFNFKTAYFFTFVSGIWMTMAVNLFTTLVLTKDLPVCNCRLYQIIFLFFIGALGAFGISALLEVARSEWESDDKNPDEQIIYKNYIHRGNRSILHWILFAICVLSPIAGLIILL